MSKIDYCAKNIIIETMSIEYNSQGGLSKIEDTFQGKPYFMKIINTDDSSQRTELTIASILQKNPLKNVVKVLDISYKCPVHIKYELLDVEKNWDKPLEKETMLIDIKNGLTQLHQKNIIYIDLKEDNIGYSSKNKEWKLFDFDCSGITMPDMEKWLIIPPKFFMWNAIHKLKSNMNFYIGEKKISCVEEIRVLDTIAQSKKLSSLDSLAFHMTFQRLLW